MSYARVMNEVKRAFFSLSFHCDLCYNHSKSLIPSLPPSLSASRQDGCPGLRNVPNH